MGEYILSVREAIREHYEQTGVEMTDLLVDEDTFVRIMSEAGYVVSDGSSIFIDGVRVYVTV